MAWRPLAPRNQKWGTGGPPRLRLATLPWRCLSAAAGGPNESSHGVSRQVRMVLRRRKGYASASPPCPRRSCHRASCARFAPMATPPGPVQVQEVRGAIPSRKAFNRIPFVSLHGERRRTLGGGPGWHWRWPPRQLDLGSSLPRRQIRSCSPLGLPHPRDRPAV